EQLERAERLSHHRIRPGLVRAVELAAVTAAEHDDRDLARLRVAAEAPAEVGSTDARQTEVEDDRVGQVYAEQGECLLTGSGLDDIDRRALERDAQQLAERRLVIDEQDPQ